MKTLKVIILLSLILKVSTNVDGWFLHHISGSDACHSTEVSLGCDKDLSQDRSTSKPCCGDTCDCLCCGHIYTSILADYTIALTAEDNHVSSFDFYINYQYLFSDLVWQPPQLI